MAGHANRLQVIPFTKQTVDEDVPSLKAFVRVHSRIDMIYVHILLCKLLLTNLTAIVLSQPTTFGVNFLLSLGCV